MRRFLAGVALAALGAIWVTGCGGGGGSGDSGSLPSSVWKAYTPPDTAVSTVGRDSFLTVEAFAVPAAIKTGNATQWLFPYGNVKALANMVSNVLAPAARQLAGELGVTLPAAVRPASADEVLLSVATSVASRPAEIRPAQVTPQTFDWTDPAFGIRWTGSLAQQGTSVSISLHGAGPNTDCTVSITIVPTTRSFSLTGATLTGTIDGTVAASVDQVDWGTGARAPTMGRAAVLSQLSVTATKTGSNTGTFSGTGDMTGDFQLGTAGGWTTEARQQINARPTGTWNGSAIDVAGSVTQYDGVAVGSDLFWCRHDVTGSVTTNTALSSVTGSLTDQFAFSNSMAGQLGVSFPVGPSTATLSGRIVAADGTAQLAAIGGTLDASVGSGRASIAWYGGALQVQDWLFM